MSNVALNWAWKLKLPANEKLVLVALADRANDEGKKCFPSQVDISKRTGLHRSTLTRLLKSLERRKLVEVKQRKGGSGYRRAHEYFLNLKGSNVRHLNVADQDIYMSQDATQNHQYKPSVEPVDCGETPPPNPNPTGERKVKVQDILDKQEKPTHEGIVAACVKKGGKYQVSMLGKMWNKLCALHHEKFMPEMTKVELSQLGHVQKKLGDDVKPVLAMVIPEWTQFTKYAQKYDGAFNMPLQPQIGFLLKFAGAAKNFTDWMNAPAEEFSIPSAQLIAQKLPPESLTNESGSSTKGEKPATLEEVMKILGDE